MIGVLVASVYMPKGSPKPTLRNIHKTWAKVLAQESKVVFFILPLLAACHFCHILPQLATFCFVPFLPKAQSIFKRAQASSPEAPDEGRVAPVSTPRGVWVLLLFNASLSGNLAGGFTKVGTLASCLWRVLQTKMN